MSLIIATVVVIALLISTLVIFLFGIGVALNRTADNLGDCVQNVKNIAHQAEIIGPAVERINAAGGALVGALPLLCEAADRIGAANSAPYVNPSETPTTPHAVPSAVLAAPTSLGYLDENDGSLGYLDT